jgi:hypothetical protein
VTTPQSERVLRARLAAHSKWATTPDRSEATAAARQAFNDRFAREVDPDGVLDPIERAVRAESARKAHYTRLALRSAQSRRRGKKLLAEADAADAEMSRLDGGDAA